jgi:hypothetical protein
LIGVKEITIEDGGGGIGEDARVPDLSPDAEPPRNCPLNCLPPPPPGWVGPSAVFDGVLEAQPKNCPALYTILETIAHQGLHASAAICPCGTPTLSGAVACKVRHDTYETCTGGVPSVTTDVIVGSAPVCISTGGASTGTIFKNVVLTDAGSCVYPNPAPNIPPLTFDKVYVACGLPAKASCNDARADCIAAPIPEAPFTRFCLHARGDISCPSFDYPVRFVAPDRIDDNRACNFTGCVPTAPTGVTCGSKFEIVPTAQCPTAPAAPATLSLDSCIEGTNNESFNLRGLGPSGTPACPNLTGTPTGNAISANPVTFCCTR